MELRNILAECRAIVVQHHQQTRAGLICAIDDALNAPSPRWTDAAVESIALGTELPVGTVARVLRQAGGLAIDDGPSLRAFLADLMAWQDETFGRRQTLRGVLDHVVKEIEQEIRPDPTNLDEWLGLMNLSVSAQRLAGATPEQMVEAWQLLLAELKARRWPDWRTADPDRAIEHDRSADSHPRKEQG